MQRLFNSFCFNLIFRIVLSLSNVELYRHTRCNAIVDITGNASLNLMAFYSLLFYYMYTYGCMFLVTFCSGLIKNATPADLLLSYPPQIFYFSLGDRLQNRKPGGGKEGNSYKVHNNGRSGLHSVWLGCNKQAGWAVQTYAFN